MKLIIGLGNFPVKYEQTRHNIGFMLIDLIQKTGQFDPWKLNSKFSGQVSKGEFAGHKCVLLKPHTLMNLSGNAVAGVRRFYKIHPSDLVVLSDDLDQAFMALRWRDKGSSGGHNGLKDIIKALGTEHFPRLKMGIDNQERTKIPTEHFVLKPFNTSEKQQLPNLLNTALKKLTEHLTC